MHLKELHLKNFRCFSAKTLRFNSNIVILEGANGIGKTSLLEALHYACYLRSFRTYTPKELLQFEQQHFLIKILFEHTELDIPTQSNLQVSYFDKKRLVKLNDKAIDSYKELMDHYRIITLTEDDMGLIKLGPDMRRQFIDQALLLHKPTYLMQGKEYKTVLDNRNVVLQQHRVDKQMWYLWSEQLWHKSIAIQTDRIAMVARLQEEVSLLLAEHLPEIEICFTYAPKKDLAGSYQEFTARYTTLFEQEQRFRRSLFGVHLDDIDISFKGTASRTFASRGQQKLILLLIKIAQVKALCRQKGPAIFLLDDFITDFDTTYARIVLNMLTNLNIQLIFTVPTAGSAFIDLIAKEGVQTVKISD